MLILGPDGDGDINSILNTEVNMRDKVVTEIETQVWDALRTASQARVRIEMRGAVRLGVEAGIRLEMGMNPFLVA